MVGCWLQLHFPRLKDQRRDAAGWTTAVLEQRIYSCPITLEAPSFPGNAPPCRRGDVRLSVNGSNRQLCFRTRVCGVRPGVAGGREPAQLVQNPS